MAKTRIVSLAPSATSILCELGAKRLLVGVTHWCRDVAPVKGLPAVGDCWRTDPQAVAKLEPDLVIGSVPYKSETVDALLQQGLTFLAMNPRTLKDIFSDVRLLGRLVGREKAADKLVAKIERSLQRVEDRAGRARQHPRVYCESWPKPRMISPPWVEEMVGLAGGRFVPRHGGRIVKEQEVLAAKPEIVVLGWAACGMKVDSAKVLARPGWRALPAVRRQQVYVVSDEALNTPGPPVAQGLENLASIIHPEIFGAPRNEKIRRAA